MTAETTKKSFILIGNLDKPQTRQLGQELLDFLRNKANIVADNIEGSLDIKNLPATDFALVLGGDGTILSTVRALNDKQVPIIGVNIGKLGFLAEFSVEQFRRDFEQIVSDKTLISHRTMLHCRIVGGEGGEDFNTMVVNEIAVTAGPPFRMIEVSISIGAEHLALCAGDGLVVATPTGSTAYNLSAGGPILLSTVEAAVITPLAAHSLSFRPVVVDLEKPIVLRCRGRHLGSRSGSVNNQGPSESVVVSVDGQVAMPLKSEDEVIITRAGCRFQLVHNPQQDPLGLLNTKLNWGALPNYYRDGSE